jgi:hypothetical protein
MVSGLASNGLLRRDGNSRRYLVEAPRPARTVALEKQLRNWESYGFLTYQAQKQTGDRAASPNAYRQRGAEGDANDPGGRSTLGDAPANDVDK